MSTLIRSKLEDNDLQDQKQKAIHLAIQNIEKQFGKGSIMRLGANETLVAQDVAAVPSGSMSLDIALGIGGYPRGHVARLGWIDFSKRSEFAVCRAPIFQ